MERALRLRQLWNWLPAFRAVAESENVHQAAKRLHVTPSSVSRMIRLLEDGLGHPLFYREGRHLILNPAGEGFLDAVRDAMRRLDDGLQALEAGQAEGRVVIAATPFLSETYVLPALQALRQTHAALVPHVRPGDGTSSVKALLRGDIDLALVFRPELDRRLTVEAMGTVRYGVYCGRKHPLFRARQPSLEQILTHPFAAPDPKEGDDLGDQWPPGIARRVALYVSDIRLAVLECESGQLLTVLPDRYAAVSGRALRRLPVELVPASIVHVMRRLRTPPNDPVNAVVAAVRSVLSNSLSHSFN